MKNHLVQVVDRARQGFKRRSGSISTSQLVLGPPELWIKIFSYISAPWDIKALTLTCHCFRQLAQPLLFAKISTHPARPTLQLGLRGLQNKYRRRTSQRLEFFLSPHIAPAVRECWIDPVSAEDDDLPTDVHIDAIFDGLRKLPNLKVLGCRSIRLTANRLAVLRQLTLTTITLDSCPSDPADFTSPPAIPLSSVTFRYHDPIGQDAVLPPLLSVFLSPRHLQRLFVTSTEILPVITSGRPLKRLVHLEIPVESLVADQFIPALSQCPAVERITLYVHHEGHIPRAGVVAAIPGDVLPKLNFYRGTRHFITLFAAAGRLQTIEVSLPAKAHRLLRTLGQVHCPLDYLSFRIEGSVPKTLLQSVHSFFPTLRTLSVNDPAVSASELHALLCETSPCPNMRVLRVRVEGRDRYNLWIPPMEEAADAVECYRKVHSELGRVYPNLATLKFLYGLEGASVVWRRDSTTRQLVQAATS